MGLFDWKKTNSKNNTVELNQSLFNAITQEVAMFMMQCGILEAPELQFFYEDGGVLRAVCEEHETFDMRQIRREQPDFYMFICGMHAFGAGVYTTYSQSLLKKSVSEFTKSDVDKIMKTFKKTDAYELALQVLGVDPQSRNKAILDKIIMMGCDVVKRSAGSKVVDSISIKTFMQVMFNVGITMAMR